MTNAEYDAVANVGTSKHKKLGSGFKLYQCIYINIRVGSILIFRAVSFSCLGSCLCGIYVYLDISLGVILIFRAVGISRGTPASLL